MTRLDDKLRPTFNAGPRLEQLLAELSAINAWDQWYLSRRANDGTERAAWAARRIRLREIRQELATLLVCLDPPTTFRQN
jgi:hypothetical protein